MRRLYSHALKRAWEYARVLGTVPRRLIKFNPRITNFKPTPLTQNKVLGA